MLRSSRSARSSAIAAGRVRTLSWISSARSSCGAIARSSSSDSSSPGRCSSTGWVFRNTVGRSAALGGELDRPAPEQAGELGLAADALGDAQQLERALGQLRVAAAAERLVGRHRARARAARSAGTPSSPGPRAAARAARACPPRSGGAARAGCSATVVGRSLGVAADLAPRRSGRRGTRSRRSARCRPRRASRPRRACG